MGRLEDDDQIVEALSSCRTISDVGRCLRAFAGNHGFPHFIFGLIIPTSPVKPTHFVISGWPQGWKLAYEERDLLRLDPLVQHSFHSSNILYWDEARLKGAIAKEFFGLAERHGLADGVTCPVAGRRGERGHFSLSATQPLNYSRPERSQLSRTLHWLVAEVYEAIVRVAFTPGKPNEAGRRRTNTESPLPRPALTHREQEVLLLLSAGKTAGEIAETLRIGERTVRWHFTEAGEKLGQVGREQILAAATSSGAIIVPEVGLRSGLAKPRARVYDA